MFPLLTLDLLRSSLRRPSSLHFENSFDTSKSACIGLFRFVVGLGLLDSGCFTVTILGRAVSPEAKDPEDNFFSFRWSFAEAEDDCSRSDEDSGISPLVSPSGDPGLGLPTLQLYSPELITFSTLQIPNPHFGTQGQKRPCVLMTDLYPIHTHPVKLSPR